MLLITVTIVPLYSSVPVRHDSVTVSQHVHYEAPETEAAQLSSAIIKCINYGSFPPFPFVFTVNHFMMPAVNKRMSELFMY